MRIEKSLDLDLYCDLGADGTLLSLFIGDECDPVIEETFTYDDMIVKLFEFVSIPRSGLINEEGVKEVKEIIAGMENAVKLLKETLSSKTLFDRESWVNDGCPEDKSPYESPVET